MLQSAALMTTGEQNVSSDAKLSEVELRRLSRHVQDLIPTSNAVEQGHEAV